VHFRLVDYIMSGPMDAPGRRRRLLAGHLEGAMQYVSHAIRPNSPTNLKYTPSQYSRIGS
jgi:hypothetical protein